ncbi:MAG: carbon starvation CstA family protein, partial [Treponemataceae bacterium]
MSGIVIMLIAIIFLGGAYFLYGKLLERKWGIDPSAKTPAYEMEDGLDYVPTRKSIVFGHQFASIAGAGPINGPIQAAIFGWVPVFLWILIGGVFFGSVQDFIAMYASVKNKGKTIGYIIEMYIGKIGKKLFLAFTWLFSILVVAAFTDIVAKTFNGFGAENNLLNSNGSVAMTSLLFIVAAVGLGFLLKYTKLRTITNTLISITLLIVCIILGLIFPIYISTEYWHIVIFLYICVASIAPVWALLQPRDYLNSYLLIALIFSAVIGVIIFNPQMNLNAFNGWTVNGATLFPYLFITIACGAVSGFHALVSSGTSSKQIQNEKHILPISFGAMLLESLLAVIALCTVGYLAVGGEYPVGITPPQLFANAIAIFLTKIQIPQSISTTLITLAVSAFALTSVDSVARVGRLAF